MTRLLHGLWLLAMILLTLLLTSCASIQSNIDSVQGSSKTPIVVKGTVYRF